MEDQPTVRVLNKVPIEYIDELVRDSHNRIKPLPAAEFRQFDPNHLRLWMHTHAIYAIPTAECIMWLRRMIGARTAIEVGCGNNDFFRHLNIVGTDSCVQRDNHEVRLYMEITGQPATTPRNDVMKLDAEEAVRRLQPDVVIATYLTRKYIEGVDQQGKAQASIYGPREERIINNCQTYIHIGNRATHGQKTALRIPHDEYSFDWIITRGDPQHDIIYVWNKPQTDEAH